MVFLKKAYCTFPLYRQSPAFKIKDDGFTHEIQSSLSSVG